jgi:ribosomal protein L7/L12
LLLDMIFGMTNIHRDPKTVGWLKQVIKHLPDDYQIYFRDESGVHHSVTEIKVSEHSKQVGLLAGGLDVEIEAILVSLGKIPAVKTYREFTGAGLKESVDYINALHEKMTSDSRGD